MILRSNRFASGTVRLTTIALALVTLGAAQINVAAVGDAPRAALLPTNNRALNFEVNLGQYGSAPAFVARGPKYYLALTPTEVRLALVRMTAESTSAGAVTPQILRSTAARCQFQNLRIELLGANEQARMTGDGAVSGQANYFIGRDPAQWRTQVSTYQRVRVAECYPGIDLVHYGNEQHLEYDFIVAPEADPAAIALRFSGVAAMALTASGELLIRAGGEEIRQPRPTIYQEIHGQRRPVEGGYVLSQDNVVRFWLGKYDLSWPLVIDPVVSYAAFLGDTAADVAWAVAVDAAGAIYLAGETISAANLATDGAFQTNLAGATTLHGDVLLTKLANYPDSFVYSTYLGGNSEDAAIGLAVDGAGNAYLTGYTDSTNFPTQSGIFTNLSGGPIPGYGGRYAHDCFVAGVNSNGTALRFSTYLGGGALDAGLGIALDASTNIYVSGYTLSADFATRNTARTNYGGSGDAFVAKLDPAGTNLSYAMFLGGSGLDAALDVAVGLNDLPVVVGYTASTNFPISANAVGQRFNNTTNAATAYDVFITQVTNLVTADTNVNPLSYSTYLGGTNNDFGFRVALDATGAVYVTGATFSGDFPRTQTNIATMVISNAAASDAFVTKLNLAATNWAYSAMFGGAAKEEGWDVAVDAQQRAYVVGISASTDFPTNNLFTGLRGANAGGTDLFVIRVPASGTNTDYAGLYGGSSDDLAYGVALDGGGNVYVTGETASANFSTNSPGQTSLGGGKDSFVLKIAVEPTLQIRAAGTNIQVRWPASAPEFVLQASTNLLVTNAWRSLNAARTTTNDSLVVTVANTNSPQFFRLISP